MIPAEARGDVCDVGAWFVTLLVVGVLLLAAGATLGSRDPGGCIVAALEPSCFSMDGAARPQRVPTGFRWRIWQQSILNLAQLLGDPELGSVYKEFLVAYQEGGVEAASDWRKRAALLTPDGEHLR